MTTKNKIILGAGLAVGAVYVVGVIVSKGSGKSLTESVLWPLHRIKAKLATPSKLGTVAPTATDLANGRGIVPPTDAVELAKKVLSNPAEAAKEIVEAGAASVTPAEIIPATTA